MESLNSKQNHRLASCIVVGFLFWLLISPLQSSDAAGYDHTPNNQFVKGKPFTSSDFMYAGGNLEKSLFPHADIFLATCALTGLLAHFGSAKVEPATRSSRSIFGMGEKKFKNRNSARSQSLAGQHENAIAVLNGLISGNFEVPVAATEQQEDKLSHLLKEVQNQFREITEKEKTERWVQINMYELERLLKETENLNVLSQEIIRLLSKSVSAGVGILYDWNAEGYFEQLGVYGFFDNLNTRKKIFHGDGQLGELSVHKTPVYLTNLPKGFLVIQSGLGSAAATDVVIFPLLFKGELYGALELALFRPVTPTEILWLQRASESIGAHLFNYQVNEDAKAKLETLTKKQAEELVEIHRLQQSTYEKLEVKLKEVEAERTKNEAILEGCVDGVITFNQDGVIEFCNGAAEEIIKSKRTVLNGSSVQNVLPVVIREAAGVWNPFYKTPSGEKEISVRTEACFTTPDEETVDVLLTCTRVRHRGGMIFTFFIQKISVDLF